MVHGGWPAAVATSWLITSLAVGGAFVGGCAAQHSAANVPAGQHSEASILAGSKPAANSTARAPVEELQLRFSPPARLDELIVSGPGGVMPTMVHATGELAHYSIPLPDLGPGTYTVEWRATANGQEYRGRFTFAVS